jgi:hypothetical protein
VSCQVIKRIRKLHLALLGPSRAKKRKRERDAKQHVVSVPCSTAGKAAVNNSVAKKAGHGFHNQNHNLHQDHVFEPHSKIKPRNACKQEKSLINSSNIVMEHINDG